MFKIEQVDLYLKGISLNNKLSETNAFIQNPIKDLSESEIEDFDNSIKNVIKELGIWKTDVLMFMNENKVDEK